MKLDIDYDRIAEGLVKGDGYWTGTIGGYDVELSTTLDIGSSISYDRERICPPEVHEWLNSITLDSITAYDRESNEVKVSNFNMSELKKSIENYLEWY